MPSSILSWAVDTNGHLTYVSQSALDFFEKCPSDVLGRTSNALFIHDIDTPVDCVATSKMHHNGSKLNIQAVRVYENGQQTGVRFVAADQSLSRFTIAPFDGFLHLHPKILIAMLVGMILSSVGAIVLGGAFALMGVAGLMAIGTAVWRWSSIRAKVVQNLSSVKMRLHLHDVAALPRILSEDRLIRSCHATQIFNFSSHLREEDTLRSASLFSHVMDDHISPMVVTDHDFKILRCNQAFADLFSNDSGYFEGRSLSSVVPITTIPFNAVSLDAIHNERQYNISVAPRFLHGEVLYVSFVFEDVNCLRKNEDILLKGVSSSDCISLTEPTPFLEALKQNLELEHTKNHKFISQAFSLLGAQCESNNYNQMQEELLNCLKKISLQVSEAKHLSNNLNSQKSLLEEFIPHQSNLLDALVEEVSNSTKSSSLLTVTSNEINECSQSLCTLLGDLVQKSQAQQLKLQAVQTDIGATTHHLQVLQMDYENPVSHITMDLETCLARQQTGNSLCDVSEAAHSIQNSFVQWDHDTQEFLNLINEAAHSSRTMLDFIIQNSSHIKKLVQNVENTYDVVDVMCQDQIVHSSISECINHGVNSLQQTLTT